MPASLPRFLGEWRAPVEFLEALLRSPDSLPRRGDGQVVILIPGLWGGDYSLLPLCRNLTALGFDARTWGLGLNNRCGEATVARLLPIVHSASAAAQRSIALIGHSRGGLVAREVAQRAPEAVSRVITLGSPIAAGMRMENASPMVRGLFYLSRTLFAERPECMTERCSCDYVGRRRWALPGGVSGFSLWSREDGVVSPEHCRLKGEPHFEVPGTHLGLVANRAVVAVIVELLAAPPIAGRA